MLTSLEIEKRLKAIKPQLSSKYHVDKLGYFGSFALGEANENSDLDILISLSKPIGWEFFDIEKELENQFPLKIDLVTINGLKDRLRQDILNQAKFV